LHPKVQDETLSPVFTVGWELILLQHLYSHRTAPTENIHAQTAIPSAGFELENPVFDRAKIFQSLTPRPLQSEYNQQFKVIMKKISKEGAINFELDYFLSECRQVALNFL
jgi:hypothetical protein